MMTRWVKKGRICKPDTKVWWQQHYAIIPTPHLLPNGHLRIFFASTDSKLIGYITFIDVDADNPSQIIYRHPHPVLGPGEKGMFDEHGVNPCSIVTKDGRMYLLYVGYQRQKTVPYTLFTGLALWNNKKQLFERVQKTPVLDRIDDEVFLRSGACVLPTGKSWKMWYVAGSSWIHLNTPVYRNRLMPTYTIHTATSRDLITWQTDPHPALPYPRGDEFGFGRPWITQDKSCFRMWYSVRYASRGYRLGYAQSANGVTWKRKDHLMNIDVSPSGWDSQMICYPAVIKIKRMTYLFYNGNHNGKTGFGYAILAGT